VYSLQQNPNPKTRKCYPYSLSLHGSHAAECKAGKKIRDRHKERDTERQRGAFCGNGCHRSNLIQGGFGGGGFLGGFLGGWGNIGPVSQGRRVSKSRLMMLKDKGEGEVKSGEFDVEARSCLLSSWRSSS